VVEETYTIQEQWLALKRAATSPGVTISEISAMDIFDFFTLLREAQRQQPKQ